MSKNIFEIVAILANTALVYLKFFFFGVRISADFSKYKFLLLGYYYGRLNIRGRPRTISIGGYLRTLGDVTFVFGEKQTGGLSLGNEVILESGACLAPRNGRVQLGDGVFVGPNVLIQSHDNVSVVVGNDVIIAKDVSILASNHVMDNPSSGYRGEVGGDVVIGANVWVGAGVKVLAGVTVGECSIIAAGAVVSKNVDAYSIYGGVPAKKIKWYDLNEQSWVPVVCGAAVQ